MELTDVISIEDQIIKYIQIHGFNDEISQLISEKFNVLEFEYLYSSFEDDHIRYCLIDIFNKINEECAYEFNYRSFYVLNINTFNYFLRNDFSLNNISSPDKSLFYSVHTNILSIVHEINLEFKIGKELQIFDYLILLHIYPKQLIINKIKTIKGYKRKDQTEKIEWQIKSFFEEIKTNYIIRLDSPEFKQFLRLNKQELLLSGFEYSCNKSELIDLLKQRTTKINGSFKEIPENIQINFNDDIINKNKVIEFLHTFLNLESNNQDAISLKDIETFLFSISNSHTEMFLNVPWYKPNIVSECLNIVMEKIEFYKLVTVFYLLREEGYLKNISTKLPRILLLYFNTDMKETTIKNILIGNGGTKKIDDFVTYFLNQIRKNTIKH